ncbi:MAG TPA: DUF885 domain-containing protein [Acidimicrobiia bacterium]|nr:DUF885 domain-containing protein [Acidimicrobiia bacterium]
MSILELSDRLVDDIASLSPIAATLMGIPGYDHLWQDFSPEGVQRAADMLRTYEAAALRLDDSGDDWERLARRVLLDFVGRSLSEIESGDHLRDVNNSASPLQMVVQVFDMMDAQSAEGCSNIVRRLSSMEQVLGSYRDALEEGVVRNLLAARRQVASAVEECRSHAGHGSFLENLASRVTACEEADVASLSTAVEAARKAFGSLADYLEQEYLPVAPIEDAVGEARYVRAARHFLGADIDTLDTYAWGWSEVRTLWDRMERVAGEIAPGRSVADVLRLLKTDPDRCVPDEGAFLDFIRNRQVDAVERLSGSHFEIPDKMRHVDVKLAPAGSALGAYYMQPSEDFSRPGAVFYALPDRRPISIYDEVSTAYHEGYPGHHLQIGIQVGLADNLSRLHRMVVWYPGYGEGWALYVEELMDELGFYDRPDYVMGLLVNQMHRACRVVIDIGCHVGYAIPDDAGFHPGEVWSYDLAVELLEQRAFLDPSYARSEVTRYLGWPGQAISYKVGERVIREIRAGLEQRYGDSFDVKKFHSDLLGCGPLGLDHLREVMLGESR